jgi:tyrosinase
MPVTRKNILTNSASRDKFIQGVKRLKQDFPFAGGLSTYDLFVRWHHETMMTHTPPTQTSRNAAHVGPVFLPWHRHMLMLFEAQLQRVLQDATFGLPYWSWNADGDKPLSAQLASPLWSPQALGGDGDPVTSGPFAFNPADPQSWRVRIEAVFNSSTGVTSLAAANRGLRRSRGVDAPRLPTTAQVRAALARSAYDSMPYEGTSMKAFRNYVEGWRPKPAPRSHNLVHVWVGGDMSPSTSPNDPVFFLNHANVDRIWAAWQQKYGPTKYAPADTAPSDLLRHRPGDNLLTMLAGQAPKVSDMFSVGSVYIYDTLADLA